MWRRPYHQQSFDPQWEPLFGSRILDILLSLYFAIASDFQFYTLAPPLANGWTLLGEPSKWISVSNRRFAGISSDSQQVGVTLRGMSGENVAVGWVTNTGRYVRASCTITSSDSVRMTVDTNTLNVTCQ